MSRKEKNKQGMYQRKRNQKKFYEERIKREAEKEKEAGRSANAAQNGFGRISERPQDACNRLKKWSEDHSFLLTVGSLILIVSLFIATAMSSCSVMMQGGTNIVLDTSYTADEDEMRLVEEAYAAKEAALSGKIAGIREAYPGYDEYKISSDEIGHNPYELMSFLTVIYENFTYEQVKEKLEEIFQSQYELVLAPREYTAQKEDEEPHAVHVLEARLVNHGLTEILLNEHLSEDQMGRYQVLMATYGNYPDLFADNIYAVSARDVLRYDIPGEALTDERFARMITEAEKYLGYPYVWGGASPSTSFDCSGFVSWVINHCGNGWNYGRLTAEGLRKVCDIIPASEAKPGDLVFFQGTYATSGASHVAIYVGDGMMLHAGNPIQYASMETNYWRAHFYCFGRLR